MTVVSRYPPRCAGQGEYSPCNSFLLQKERRISTGKVFNNGERTPTQSKSHYKLLHSFTRLEVWRSWYQREQQSILSVCASGLFATGIRDPVRTVIQNQLHARFQERRHAWQGPNATIMYTNIFNPTIKMNQNRIRLFRVEVFSIIRNENAKQAKSFRTQWIFSPCLSGWMPSQA